MANLLYDGELEPCQSYNWKYPWESQILQVGGIQHWWRGSLCGVTHHTLRGLAVPNTLSDLLTSHLFLFRPSSLRKEGEAACSFSLHCEACPKSTQVAPCLTAPLCPASLISSVLFADETRGNLSVRPRGARRPLGRQGLTGAGTDRWHRPASHLKPCAFCPAAEFRGQSLLALTLIWVAQTFLIPGMQVQGPASHQCVSKAGRC